MKEQKHRFGDKTSKENIHVLSETPKHDSPKPERPQLAIAISLSEEAEELLNHTSRASPTLTVNQLASTDEANADEGADISAWAMMEHYEVGDKSSSRPKIQGIDGMSESTIFKYSPTLWDMSFARDEESLQLSPESQDSSPSEATPSTITRTTQNIFVPSTGEVMPSPVKGDAPVIFHWNTPSPLTSKNTAHHKIDDLESKQDTGPTPAKMKALWIEEKKNADNLESPPVSLLQESLIFSDATNNNSMIPSLQTVESDANALDSHDGQNYDDDSNKVFAQLNVATIAQQPKAPFELSTYSAAFNSKALNNDRIMQQSRSSHHIEISSKPIFPVIPPIDREADFAHLEKIDELERELKEQKENTDHVHYKLKERVIELEETLRAAAATPRGTIIQENPLKTLLDRNQTLVKEVRFADATCVELSGRVSALEAEKQILQDQIRSLQKQNKELRTDYKHVLLDGASISRQDQQAGSSVFSVTTAPFDDKESVLRQVIFELKDEIAEMTPEEQELTTSLASLLSDIEISLDRECYSHAEHLESPFTSQCLATALQAQVRLLKEQKQLAKHNQELKMRLEAAQSRGDEVELLLQKERPNKNTTEDSKLSLDLSRAQEESDFLGRQLGKVQQTLDKTRLELEEERKKTIAVDSKWRTETTKHLRTIRLLEAQVNKASNSLVADHSKTQSPDLDIMFIEQELLTAKANLVSFKEEVERLLSEDFNKVLLSTPGTLDSEVTRLVAAVAGKMRHHYYNLDLQVEQICNRFCGRLQQLADTVKFLRSSLLFEAESVTTTMTQTQGKHADSPIKLEWREQELDDDDDDIFSRMEEARGSPPRQNSLVDDLSSDIDDISRLLSDDSTLESMLRTAVSENTGFLELEILKKPLEFALRECQRVRDRSIALKEELKREKIAFLQLEMENRRIVVEYSRKEEEKKLVEEALEEAKVQIDDFQSIVYNLHENSQKQNAKLSALETQCEILEGDKKTLEEKVQDLAIQRCETEANMETLRSEIADTKKELESAYANSEDRERAYCILKSHLEKIEAHAFETEDLLLESRCKQEDMRKERAELRIQLARSESEVQSAKDNFDRVLERSQKQIEDMSKTINKLKLQSDEAQTKIRRFSSIYNDILDLFHRSNFVSFAKSGSDAETSQGVDWSLLAQVVPFISTTLNDIEAKHTEIDMLRNDFLRLQDDFKRSTELTNNHQQQLEDEKAQNRKLTELLQQAEQEMERSVDQIREMSSALSKMQQQEDDKTTKIQALEYELEVMREELSMVRNTLSNERKLAQQRGIEFSHELSTKQRSEEELRSALESMESKTARLREYVKKLTLKCEEWEKSYERQGKSLEKLQFRHARMREKAAEMASKYKQLSGHVKSKNKVSTL